MEVENYSPLWTARERVVLDKMEKYLQRIEHIQVEVSELERFLLDPGDADISIMSFAENAFDTPRCKGGG